MARCGCSNTTQCACFFEDGNNTIVNGSGSQDDPWSIDADVPISEDPNNCLEEGSDGGLYVECTTGAGADGIGCGLTRDGDDLVVATSGTFGVGPLDYTAGGLIPAPDCDDTQGGPIYCDSNGELRGLAEHYSTGDVGRTNEENIGLTIPNDPQFYRITSPEVTITNLSTCRTMYISIDAWAAFRVRWNQGGNFGPVRLRARRSNSQNGGAFIPDSTSFWEVGPTDEVHTYELNQPQRAAILPNSTFTYQNRLELSITFNGFNRPTLEQAEIQANIHGTTR